jgi:hypothetical protein
MSAATHADEPRLRINDWNDVDRAIGWLNSGGYVGTAHLYRGLRDGRFALLPIGPDCSASRFKAWARLTRNKPAIAMIGDDDGLDRGPAAWPRAARILRWARGIMLHGSGAEVAHYEVAIVAAQMLGRYCIIETTSALLPVWATLIKTLPPVPTLVIHPREGQHPLPVRPGDLH